MADTESRSASRNRSPKPDRWTAWPAFATLAISLIVTFLGGLPGIVGFFLGPLAALGALLVEAGLIIMALVVAVRRRPRMATSLLSAALLPLLLWKPIDWTAYTMHLALAVWTGAVSRTARSSATTGQSGSQGPSHIPYLRCDGRDRSSARIAQATHRVRARVWRDLCGQGHPFAGPLLRMRVR